MFPEVFLRSEWSTSARVQVGATRARTGGSLLYRKCINIFDMSIIFYIAAVRHCLNFIDLHLNQKRIQPFDTLIRLFLDLNFY